MIPNDGEGLTDLDVIMKVLDILQMRMAARPPRNDEDVQISQIINQFLPGSNAGVILQPNNIDIEGSTTMGDSYDVHGNAQVGAVGNRAKGKLMAFGSGTSENLPIDISTLIAELKLLRAEMRARATTTEEDTAVVAAGQAIASAETNDA